MEILLKDKNGNNIKIGDKLNISFGNTHLLSKYKHQNVEVYFSQDLLQVCVKGGNITSTCFETPLVAYVNPEYEII